MHRTEGPNYIDESGKRRYKETPSPATVVNKFSMNAIQEEICLAIEGAGITLNASGTADRTAGWGQLNQAILDRISAGIASSSATAHITADGSSHSDVGLNNTHRGSDGTGHSHVGLNDTLRGQVNADFTLIESGDIDIELVGGGTWTPVSASNKIYHKQIGVSNAWSFVHNIIGTITVATSTTIKLRLDTTFSFTTDFAPYVNGICLIAIGGTEEVGYCEVGWETGNKTYLDFKRLNGSAFPTGSEIHIRFNHTSPVIDVGP